MAVRLSLGAGRSRVVRQLLTESVMLAVAGGVLGLAVALSGIRFITWLLANGRDNFTFRADLNWHVLGVLAVLSIATGVLFGLAPAIQSTKVDLMHSLKNSSAAPRTHSFRRLTLSRILIVAQIAITLLILVVTGLFIRTLSNLQSIQLGFNKENLLTFQLNARQAGHKDPEILAFYKDLHARFAAIPGVQSATLSDVPLIGDGTSGTGVSVAGAEPEGARVLTVGGNFFTTMQIPILRGREIDERDLSGSTRVAVVNESFAKSNFGSENPVGRSLQMPRACPKCDIHIVGVSRDVLYGNIKERIWPTVYLPFTQGVWGPVQGMAYELRTASNPLRLVDTVRAIVHQADERLPLFEVKTQAALIDRTIAQEIAFARLCTAFAILALTIACVGLYGTMSYNVARRTGEIGIRMALGARRGRVLWIVMREVLLLVAAGLAISVPVALGAARAVESYLYGMKPNDPLTLVLTIIVLVGAAALAGYLPARNASRIDPMIALRHE